MLIIIVLLVSTYLRWWSIHREHHAVCPGGWGTRSTIDISSHNIRTFGVISVTSRPAPHTLAFSYFKVKINFQHINCIFRMYEKLTSNACERWIQQSDQLIPDCSAQIKRNDCLFREYSSFFSRFSRCSCMHGALAYCKRTNLLLSLSMG